MEKGEERGEIGRGNRWVKGEEAESGEKGETKESGKVTFQQIELRKGQRPDASV